LGSITSKDNGGTDKDVAVRTKKARVVFGMLNTVWRSTTYSNNTKLSIFNTNVKSVLLYGSETWRLTRAITHQLQVLVSRCIRRILNTFWPVQKSNQELWTRSGIFAACGVVPWLCRRSDPVGWLCVRWGVCSSYSPMDTQPANRIWPPTQPRHYTTRGKNSTKSSAPEDGHKVARNMLRNL